MKNALKILVHKIFVYYFVHFPIERGKYFLLRLMHKFGDAQYNIRGIKVLLSPASSLDRGYILNGFKMEGIEKTIRIVLKNGGHCLDVGANIGYFSMVASQVLQELGLVFSFEPSPREYDKLLTHLQLNNMQNIKTFNKGINPENKTTNFYLSSFENVGANSRHQKTELCIHAEFAPLDSMMSADELSKVRCVKIDVEGDEMFVLKAIEPNMQYLRNSFFIIEIHRDYQVNAGYTPDDIYEFFTRHNFRTLDGNGRKDYKLYDEYFYASERNSGDFSEIQSCNVHVK